MSLPPPGTILADKYRLEALLGEGGMGAVFRARHVLMDTPVAVKWLRPDVIDSADARERLLREARAVARIRHPNVVHVYDVDIHDGAPFIVMELLEGQSFADLMARESLPIARVLDILIGAMRGCAAAHEHGIVHRDIKPENIFIARERRHPDGVPKLLDFGVSKSMDHQERGGRITPTGQSVGTPIFMSVEQLTGAEEVDERSDVYSFGVVLYRALTGRLPFDGDTFASVVIDIATKDAVSAKQVRPDLPSSLDAVVMKAMARRREDRYSSVDALIAAIRAAEQTFGSTPQSVYASVLTPKPPAPLHALRAEAGADSEVFYPETRRPLRSYAVIASIGLAVGALGWTLFMNDESAQHAERPSGAEVAPEASPPALPEPPKSTTGSAASAASTGSAPASLDSKNPSPSQGDSARTTKPNAAPRSIPQPAPKLKDGAKVAGEARDSTLRGTPRNLPGRTQAAAPIAPNKRDSGAQTSSPREQTINDRAAAPSSPSTPPPAPARRTRSGGLTKDDF